LTNMMGRSGLLKFTALGDNMNNFVKYKQHVLAKNSEAYSIWVAADKSKPEERKLLLRKLDQHLKLLDQQHKQLLERYDTPNL